MDGDQRSSAVETVFLVLVRSENVGPSAATSVPEAHRRDLWRALHPRLPMARVFTGGVELHWDAYADDMGHHPGHDQPITATAADTMSVRLVEELFERDIVAVAAGHWVATADPRLADEQRFGRFLKAARAAWWEARRAESADPR
jgi:hypothetical protein